MMFRFQEDRTDEEIEDFMLEFKKKNHHAIFKNFSVSKYERAKREPDILPMPIELFRTESADERRNIFYKCLRRGDLLYLQVINSLPESYKLWVLAKHNGCTKVDDLRLVMHLPKFERNLLDAELDTGDFIRAALCSCSLHERKLYVTVDETFTALEEEVEVKLGKVTFQELPEYVGNYKSGVSYVGYIHQSQSFYNPGWAKQMCKVLGFQRRRLYSFFEGWDGKSYPSSEYGTELKKKQLLMQSNKYYNKAVESYEKGSIDKTFQYLNSALNISPDNVQALTTRGTVHANTNNLRKAFIDTEEALKIDPAFKDARKQMSKLLVAAARTHLEQGNTVKAQESLKMSSSLDDDNHEAIKALQNLIPSRTSKMSGRHLVRDTERFGTSSLSSVSRSPVRRQTTAVLSPVKKREVKHHRKRSRHHHSRHSHHRRHRSRSRSPKRY